MESIRVFVRVRGDEGCSDGSGDACIVTRGRTVEISARAPPSSTVPSSVVPKPHVHESNSEYNADASGQIEARRGFSFTFDEVFPASASQEEVFEKVLHLVDESFNGFNVTIFAYGMTGSGKTHTISGTYDKPGIFIKLAKYLFAQLNSSSISDNSVSMVFLSYIELYNNNLYDLLNSNSAVDGESSVRLHEHPAQGVIVTGSKSLRTPVHSAEEALELVAKGNKLRAVSSTQLNERSSRSHTIITFDVVMRTIDDNGTEKEHSSRINLVDLAGSERLKMSGADGKVLEETKYINKALSSLGDVLNALSKHYIDSQDGNNRQIGHIPYRDSKLTMLLKSSLGGNTKTIMLATVRNSSAFYHQSLTTLRYAARARHIKNIPIRNIAHVNMSGDFGGEAGTAHDMMQTKLQEIMDLRRQLQSRNDECSELRKQLDTVTSTSTTHTTSEDESGLYVKYEEMLRDLETRKNQEEAELKKRLKYVIMKKAEIYENNLDAKDKKLQELSRIIELTQIQKEKADFTNKELHRKIQEGQREIIELRNKNEELVSQSNASKADASIASSGSVAVLTKSKEKYKLLSKELQTIGRRQRDTIARYEAKMYSLRQNIASLVGVVSKDTNETDSSFDGNVESIISMVTLFLHPPPTHSKVEDPRAVVHSSPQSPPDNIQSELDRFRSLLEESNSQLSELKSDHELEVSRIQSDHAEASKIMKNEMMELQRKLDESIQEQLAIKQSHERYILEAQKKNLADIQSYEHQVKLLKTDVAQYKSQIFEMRNVVADCGKLGENNTELRLNNQRLTDDLCRSETLVRQLQNDITRLESMIDEVKSAHQLELSKILEENNQRLNEMNGQIRISNNQIKRLKEIIRSSDESLENLSSRHKLEISQIKERHARELTDLASMHKSTIKTMIDDHDRATTALNNSVSEKEKQISYLKSTISVLESKMEKSASDMHAALEKSKQQFDESESERISAIEAFAKLKADHCLLESVLKRRDLEFEKYKDSAEINLSQMREESNNALQLYQKENKLLEDSLTAKYAESVANYESQIIEIKSKANIELKSMEIKLDQKSREVVLLENRSRQLDEAMQTMKHRHLLEINEGISRHNEDLLELQEKNEAQALELVHLKSELEKMQKIRRNFQNDLKSQFDKTVSQSEILQDNQIKIELMESEIQQLRKFKEEHESRLKTLKTSLENAESKNAELVETFEAEAQKIRGECIALLKKGVGDSADESVALDAESTTDKMLDCRSIINLMRSQELTMYQQLSRKTDEVARYRRQLSELKTTFSEDVNCKEQRINELETANEASITEIASLKEKNKYFQEKLSSAMRESDHRVSQLQELLRGEQELSRSLQTELQRCRRDKSDVVARLSEALKDKSSVNKLSERLVSSNVSSSFESIAITSSVLV